MRNVLFLFTLIFTLNSCSTYKVVNMNNLYMGMSKSEVRKLFGSPDRVLFAGWIDNGYEEVLQYTTNYGDIYALTFFNDYLESYGLIEANIPVTNLSRPPYYRPLYPPARPVNNKKPSNNSKPNNNSRPNTNNNTGGSSSTPRTGNSGSTGTRSSSGNSNTTTNSRTNSSGSSSSRTNESESSSRTTNSSRSSGSNENTSSGRSTGR